MLRMFRFMKKNVIWILIIFGLLLGQAYCDLSLPSYTSKIVDTGLQQKGVEDAVADSFRVETMQNLLYVSTEKNQKTIEDGYTYSKKKDMYVVKDLDTESHDHLNDVLSKAEMMLYIMEKRNIPVQMIPQVQMPQVRKEINKRLKDYPDTMITQAAILFVQQEYKAQGIDLDQKQSDYLWNTGKKMILMAVVAMVCSILVALLASRIAAELGKDLRNKTYETVLTYSAKEMNQFSTASLITRSTNDIQQIQLVMTMIFRVVLYAPILAVGGIIKVQQTGSYLSWILIVAVGVLSVVMAILFGVVMPKFKILQKLIDRVNLISREILTGIPVIRAFSAEKFEEKRFDKANQDLTKTNLFVNRAMSCMMPLMMLIMNGISVLIVYSGAHGIDAGKLQVGDMMAFIQYAMQIIIAFLMISAIAIFLPRANVSANRINEILDTKSSIKEPEHPQTPEKQGKLVFDHVSFSYGHAKEKVLDDINFTAHQGDTIALIGSTGSGKSTLVNLIPRFYDVTEGSILMDDVDIRNIDLKTLRDRIGFVPQKSVLFSGTIASNLRFGKKDALESELWDAIDMAQAEDFVSEKEHGMDSHIAQGGSNVSGGQKQRLAIARAIVKHPEFLVFDDSFSALDFATDARLRKALKEKASDVTTIIVAQRISTIMHADQILVLDHGKVVGQGTHEQLMKTCDVYQQIAQSQLSQEELAYE